MRIIYGILFAIIYTLSYVFVAMLSTGGGHGNFIVMLPVHITWLINFIALILLTQLKHKIMRIVFVVIMAAYYAALLYMLSNALNDPDIPYKKLVTEPSGVVFSTAWFIAGQLIIWALFLRKIVRLKYGDDIENISISKNLP